MAFKVQSYPLTEHKIKQWTVDSNIIYHKIMNKFQRQ